MKRKFAAPPAKFGDPDKTTAPALRSQHPGTLVQPAPWGMPTPPTSSPQRAPGAPLPASAPPPPAVGRPPLMACPEWIGATQTPPPPVHWPHSPGSIQAKWPTQPAASPLVPAHEMPPVIQMSMMEDDDPPYSDNMTLPIKKLYMEDDARRAMDANGKIFQVFKSSNEKRFWRKISRKKKEKQQGFHPYMRAPMGGPTMQDAANHVNNMMALSFLPQPARDFVPIIQNTDPRDDQPGKVMAAWLGSDGVEQAYEEVGRGCDNKKYLSASVYAKEDNWEWLHLIAHCLGGGDVWNNLVAGSYGANTEMLAIEKALIEYPNKAEIGASVHATLVGGTKCDKPYRKAITVNYVIYKNGAKVFERLIDAQRGTVHRSGYDGTLNEVRYALGLAEKPQSRKIEFVKGGML